MQLTCKCGKSWDYQGKNPLYASCPDCKTSVRIPGRYPTLLAWHMRHSLRVENCGGHSYVVVPQGNDLGGHLETVRKCATVKGWDVIEDPEFVFVPTYAYDRVVVAGIRCQLGED